MTSRCDVLVLGGGPAGAATAIALARRGRSVVVLERSHYHRARIGETLPPIANAALARLGLDDILARGKHLPAPGIISAWGDGDLYEEQFIVNPYGQGWHLDRRRFDLALAAAAAAAGARLQRGADLLACVADAGGWQIDFTAWDADRRKRLSLHATFVVDATGRSACLARRQEVKRIRYDRLVGIVGLFASLGLDRPADTRTLVEAAPDGWWYSAYLPGGKLIAAYMTDADLVPRGLACLSAYWHLRLLQAPNTRARAEGHALEQRLKTVLADSTVLEVASGRRWLAVGDAAMTYDPLSSFGLYKALGSGLVAAETVSRCQARRTDVPAAYAEGIRAEFERYLATRSVHYRREQRWPSSPFWRRRWG